MNFRKILVVMIMKYKKKRILEIREDLSIECRKINNINHLKLILHKHNKNMTNRKY
jgi:hypothetical protein